MANDIFLRAVDTLGEGMSRERLFELAAQADEQLRHFYVNNADQDQNQDPSRAGTIARGVAGAGAVAGAAYGANKLRNSVINRAGAVDDYGNLVARKGMYQAAAPGMLKDAKGVVKDAAKQGLQSTASVAGQASNSLYHKAVAAGVPYSQTPGVAGMVRKAQGASSGFLGEAAKGLRTVAKDLTRADVDRIVELAQRIEGLVDFDDAPAAPQQRGKVGMYLVGGPQGLYNQKKFKDSGLVYRKRDAYVDGAKGGLTEVAAGGAAAAGAYGLGRAGVSGKLPKGILRKGAVKAAQFMKKSPMGTMAAITAGATGAGIAGVQHSANKRKAALLKQRMAGADA